jgi:diguanylate cyclase (GGDEF)-like protein/PAS domain S-box-containing protein
MRETQSRRVAGKTRRTAARLSIFIVAVVLGLFAALSVQPALALEPIEVKPDQDWIEITGQGELHGGAGDTLQVETASGPDGVVGRMSVRATTPGTSPNWLVFALHNPTDKPIERWLTAEKYTVIGSSVIWPDLDARRIEAVTPSLGFLPDRVKSDRADIFRITLEPGQTITYAAELASDRIPRVYLWKPLEYELKARDRQLFNGIMLGITGLLAIFLTAVFAANHKAIFPAAALVAWCVLAYLCVDFGFWHKLLQLRSEDNAVYRAATESAIAASLVIFVTIFLRIGLWHGFIRLLATIWIVAQLALVFVAVIDPRLAATFARASFVAIGGVGALVTLYLALRGQDRALALIPTWLLFLVWIFAAGVTLTGQLVGDVVVSGLVAGLVLIVVLLGFTVTQFAFRSFEPFYGAAPSEMELRSLAIDGASAGVWQWLARRDEIKVSPVIEAALGLGPGELSAKVDDFAKHLHPADRERFRLVLWGVQERNGGTIHIELRLRHADNSYRWFSIEAASIPHTDRRALRCVGLMRDITESKRVQERLMQNAVYCSLTGLPNRELFLDRLGVALTRAKSEPHLRPTVFFIDIDKFKNVNASLGLMVADSVLLTVARRLMRHIGPQDTLARVGGDQFAMLLIGHQDPRELALLAERVRRSLHSPIKIAGQEISLTTSTGIATMTGSEDGPQDLLREAEIAMYRAKRAGPDRVEIFVPDMRNEPDDRAHFKTDLERALEKGQIKISFQPIIYLPTEELAGFEAIVRWQHPKRGPLTFSDIADLAKDSVEHVVKLGSYVLFHAAEEAAKWQRELPRGDNPLFVSINLSNEHFFHPDFIQEVRHILGRALVPAGVLRLEISESVAMSNPEQAVHALEVLRGAGASLSIDEFGTGYSSLPYLQRFAFDTIKIDSGLVQSSAGDGPGAPIVRSIVAISHEFGKKVIGEGIEIAEDASFLRGLGCDFGQGVYYGEPMSDREALQLLRTIRKTERRVQRRLFRTKSVSRKRKSDKATVKEAPATEKAAEVVQAGAPKEPALSGEAPDLAAKTNGAGKLGETKAASEKPPVRASAPQILARLAGKRLSKSALEKPDQAAPSQQKPAAPAISLPPLPLKTEAPRASNPQPDGKSPPAAAGDVRRAPPPPPQPEPRPAPPPTQAGPRTAPPPVRGGSDAVSGAKSPATQGGPPRRPARLTARAPQAVPMPQQDAPKTLPPPIPAASANGPKPARQPAPPAPPQPAVSVKTEPPLRSTARTQSQARTASPPPPPLPGTSPGATATQPPPLHPAPGSGRPGAVPPGPPPQAARPSAAPPPAGRPAPSNGSLPPLDPPKPQYPSLPPAIAESLSKLAGVSLSDIAKSTSEQSKAKDASAPEPRSRAEAKGPLR